MTTTSPDAHGTTVPAVPPSTEPRPDGPLSAAWPADLVERALAGLPARADLGVPDAGDRAAWDAFDPVTIAAVRAKAEAERGTPWPQPLASQYARYFRDGNRTEYEGAVGARQRRLTRAVIAAAADGGTARLDEVADGVQLLCEQSGWSWAAHDDTNAAHGHVVPTASDPYLDLGAGEVAGQLAWIDQVLGTRLDERVPGLTERVRHEVALRVVDPFLTRRDWWWLGLGDEINNWNPWIHGNVLAAALRLVPDAEVRSAVVRLCIDGLDRYLASIPADGAIDEGFSYWWNGAGRALEALRTLRTVTGGLLDAAPVSVVREMLRFPLRMQLAGDWYVNAADGRGRAPAGLPWHVPFRWGILTGQPDVRAHAASNRHPDAPVASVEAGLGRMLRALADPDWTAVGAAGAAGAPGAEPAAAPLPEHTWLASTSMLVTRELAGESAGFVLAAKGGHNGENHNHKDLGSVIVAHDGHPVLVDAGQPTYTAQTFGPDRYAIRAMQSGWHSTPAPWGLEQGVGADFAAQAERMLGGPGAPEDGVVFELARAYPLGAGPLDAADTESGGERVGAGPDSWLRTAVLDRAAHRVVIDDVWDLGPCDAEGAADGILVHHLLHGEVRLDERSGTAVVDPAGVRLTWRADAPVTATLTDWELDDPLLTEVWGERLTRLTLAVDADPARGSRGRLTVTIEAEAAGPEAAEAETPRPEASEGAR